MSTSVRLFGRKPRKWFYKAQNWYGMESSVIAKESNVRLYIITGECIYK